MKRHEVIFITLILFTWLLIGFLIWSAEDLAGEPVPVDIGTAVTLTRP